MRKRFLLVVMITGLAVAETLGVTDGQLAPCPDSPNCVSSQADTTDSEHYLAAFAYTGSVASVMAALKEIVDEMPRSTVVTAEETYLHVEFRSNLFRFVDDVEFYFDDNAKLVHFRSAARLGHSDMGVNRRRMQTIGEQLQAAF